MRKKYIFGKKLYISILTSILVLLTTVATTFAWVGVFANSTFETFDINIVKADMFEDYNIIVSSTGNEGTFSDSIDPYDIKRQVLVNWGYDENLLLKTDSEGKKVNDTKKIDFYFNTLSLDQATTLPTINGNKLQQLGEFYDVYGDITKKYFKFDIYVSVEQIGISSHSDFNLDVYLGLDSLTGRIKGKNLLNPVHYPDDFINPYDSLIENGTMTLLNGQRTVKANEMISYAQVDSKYASRLAFEKYEVVEKGNPSTYENKTPKSTVIYSGDEYDYPVIINETTHLYDFGSILPNDYNLAILNYNSSEWQFTNWHYWVMNLPDNIYNIRGPQSVTKDLLITKDTNHIIDSNNPEEQIDINHMMKITVYFWFEGWDADCWNAINLSPVTIKIKLNMRNDKI